MKNAKLELPSELNQPDQTLIKKIIQDYPDINFRIGQRFSFRPPRSVVLGPAISHYTLLLAHEIGHALSGKYSFKTDLERLKIEREAWEQAKSICQKFNIPYDKNFIEDQLDSYRDWLHNKSKCKKCGLTCYQTKNGQYHCPNCEPTI